MELYECDTYQPRGTSNCITHYHQYLNLIQKTNTVGNEKHKLTGPLLLLLVILFKKLFERPYKIVVRAKQNTWMKEDNTREQQNVRNET